MKKIAAFLLVAIFARGACALGSENGADKFTALKDSRIKKITLVLMPEGIRTLRAFSERDVLITGCNFSIESNTAAINELSSILRKNISFNSNSEEKFYLRNIIILHLKDESFIKFSFGDSANSAKKIDGGVSTNENGSYSPFYSSNRLIYDLRSWVKKFIPKEELQDIKTRNCLRDTYDF